MYTDKKKYVTELFWSLIGETMVERVEPSHSPAAPDVHHLFTYCAHRWDNPPVSEEDEEDPVRAEIARELWDMIEVIREDFRDKIATLKVTVSRRPIDEKVDCYYVHLIASLGEQDE